MKILEKINHHHKKKKKQIYRILDKKIKYNISYENIDNKRYINIMEKNKKLISGRSTIYGIYQMDTKLWLWCSSLSNCDIKTIYKIEKIKSYNYLFQSLAGEKETFYYQLLTQNVLAIDNMVKLEWINELLLFLTSGMFYFNPLDKQNIQFIIMKKITQQYI